MASQFYDSPSSTPSYDFGASKIVANRFNWQGNQSINQRGGGGLEMLCTNLLAAAAAAGGGEEAARAGEATVGDGD